MRGLGSVMSMVKVIYQDGTEANYITLGTPDQAWSTLDTSNVRRVEIHPADTLAWPAEEECPVLG
jgi:hypothetical protein